MITEKLKINIRADVSEFLKQTRRIIAIHESCFRKLWSEYRHMWE